MATSLASALIKVPVKRDLAMTGEITLRGRVMPIGGLKEKLLAAHRSGITTVIVPKENRKDLREVPRRVLKATRIVLVEHMDEVLREALCLPSPDAMFGPPKERWEYREGELGCGAGGAGGGRGRGWSGEGASAGACVAVAGVGDREGPAPLPERTAFVRE
jgi:ATP-dependent Lon protease